MLEGWIAVSLGVAGIAGTIVGSMLGYRSGTASVDKDYVQMAINNLDRKDASPELRKWSVDVLSKLSPVPFGKKLETQLASAPPSVVQTRYIANLVNLPPLLSQPCPDVMKGMGKSISTEQALKVVNQYDKCRLRFNAVLNIVASYDKIWGSYNPEQGANGLQTPANK